MAGSKAVKAEKTVIILKVMITVILMENILERRHERGFLGVLVMFGFLSWC